ncbi:MAG TPA: hypothetical protein VL492_03725 [Methylovirgula sp.]|nr:hypothetical protein [Methylovirgula sp.]
MTTLLLVWGCLAIGFMMIGQGTRRGSAGLPLAYFLELSLIHTPGALLYANNPKWQPLYVLTYDGFQQTVVGLAAFLTAVLIARLTTNPPPVHFERARDQRPGMLRRISLIYIVLGFGFFVLTPLISRIPSGGAMSSALASLLIVGVAIRIWEAKQSGSSIRYWQTAALLPLLPLTTLLKDGFMSFGTNWLICTGAFFFNQSKGSRPAYILVMPFVGIFALSVFVNYMASRTEYRQLVWYQNAGITQRIDQVGKMIERFEWMDFSSERQRNAIDERLNQNVLVGMAIDRLDRRVVDYAQGSTLTDMALALIPRAIWPNKPAVGGGGDVVQRFSGYVAEAGTSVGAGQVLEFYANFGSWGVIAGFFLFGWLIAKVDLTAINYLRQGDDSGFLLWFLPGLALIQPGGNLLEVATSVASTIIAAKGLCWLRQHAAWMSPTPTRHAHPVRRLQRRGSSFHRESGLPRLPNPGAGNL